jgi:uncharacterized membrane protein
VSVLFWIGGVAFVTLVVIPSIRTMHVPDQHLIAFHRIEGRFAPQARIWVLLAGASGFWMMERGGMGYRLFELQYWWMHAMIAVWAVFALMLFVIEPLFLHRRMERSHPPAQDFARMERAHRRLLGASIVATSGAVGGSHGLGLSLLKRGRL